MLGMRGFGSHWPCRFHVVCVNFVRVGSPMRSWFLVDYELKKMIMFLYHIIYPVLPFPGCITLSHPVPPELFKALIFLVYLCIYYYERIVLCLSYLGLS